MRFRILGEHTRGVHAGRAAVPAENLVPVPEGVPLTVAGSASLVFQTAWRLLLTRGRVSPGETVLVLGASGGVGHAAVQIADHAGAEVLAAARTDTKREHAVDCGADHAIDSETESFPDRVRELTDRRGGDLARLARQPRKGGPGADLWRHHGPEPETDLDRISWNQPAVIGSTMATPGEVDDVLSLVWVRPRTPGPRPPADERDGPCPRAAGEP